MLKHIVRFSLYAAILGMVAGLFADRLSALEIPNRPTDIPIVDQTNTLSNEQKQTLARQIAEERQKSGNQIAIVMVSSLEDEALEGYSLDVARQWGVGTGENNNGVLLFIAKDDKRLRIEVGTGLEGALTDVQSGRIIRNEIAPKFQQGQFYEGIQAGLTSIIAAIHNEYTATNTATSQPTHFPWEILFFVSAFGLSWLGSILGRTKSWWAGGVLGGAAGAGIGFLLGSLIIGLIGVGVLTLLGLLFDKAVSRNYRSHVGHGDKPSWWAGGGTLGGGGSGGFGGFGGGGFGGGGSSGSW